MKILTSRFGEVAVEDSAAISFPEGVVGFPDARTFVIFDGPEGTPFKWLQSGNRPELAFVICDPLLFKPDYRIAVPAAELADLHLARIEDAVVSVILSIPSDPWRMTANLLGPVIFNAERRLGRQLVLSGTEYTTKHAVFPQGFAAPGTSAGAAPSGAGRPGA
jgi:flagellar assembly factor FliW